MDALRWYKLRNDRTQRVDNIILDSSAKRIGVYVSDESIRTYSGQVLVLLTVNILARWCRRLAIQLPQSVVSIIPGRPQIFNDLVKRTVQLADPFGDFVFGNVDEESCDIILTIGEFGKRFKGECFWADADGWVAGYGYGKASASGLLKNEEFNPVGACFAACQVNSSIFRHYLGITATGKFRKWYSLFDYQSSDTPSTLANPKIPTEITTGRLWQIGCGAVGSSFDYLLSLMKVSGIVHCLDFDQVSIPNTSSSLLFTCSDAIDEVKKIVTCEKLLSFNSGLKAIPFDGDFNDFIQAGNLENNYPDIVLCFANERSVWSSIQHNCPPLVLHATTSKNWGINFGRHIPFQEWCIVCRFGMKQLHSTPTCAKGSVKDEQGVEEILGILPFLAPAAAIQVLAEIIKLNMGTGYPFNKNFLQFSLKNNGLSDFQTQQLFGKFDCPICSTQDIRDYPEGFPHRRWT